MYTIDRIKEDYLGLLVGIISFIFVFFLNPDWINLGTIKALPQLTICTFGFLLTLLGIILQGNGPFINKFRECDKIYKRYVGYNKRTVLLSFVITILSFVVGYLDFSRLCNLLFSICPIIVLLLRKITFSLITGLIVWLVIDLWIFVKVFYILIKQP